MATIRHHLEDINNGRYQRAFGLLSAAYQEQNPKWAAVRAEADSGINIISAGHPVTQGANFNVSVVFYARDRYPTPGSDTQCREFQGTVEIINQDGKWRYNPEGNDLQGTVESRSNSNCPS